MTRANRLGAPAFVVWRWLAKVVRQRRAPRARLAALRLLRMRFAEDRAGGRASPEERTLAHALRRSREEIVRATGPVRACAVCAVKAPLPMGRWAGGYCCGGKTENLFDDVEVAALRAGGTRLRDLRGGPPEPAGCLFRGPAGCTLPPRHRPNRCLRYMCRDLQRDLHARGRLDALEAAAAENERLFTLFCEARDDRLRRQFTRSLVRAVSTARRPNGKPDGRPGRAGP